MKKAFFAAIALGIFLLVVAKSKTGPKEPTGPTGPTLELLSQYVIPAGLRFQKACIGGLSAIDYDAATGHYYVLSDDRSSARFFTLDIEIGSDADNAPAQNSPTTITGRSTFRIRCGRMKSGCGSDSTNITPANPIRNTGTRNSWKVGNQTTVRRMMRSSRAVKAFMNR